MAAEKLRDLSQPIDVGLLDATVAAFYGTGSKEERTAADHILRELQNNPEMWLQVVHILSSTQNLNTKFFALQVLEGVIKYRWNALPVEQRDGMKNYISEVIVKLSSDEISFRRERLYVNKLNIILVQILKHEWPSRWRSFIPDLVAAAKTSETICENCMAILKLLSEEVFDFSRGEMTQQKIKELKQSLNSEFQLIHELCLYVLSAASQRTELIRATLATLHAFLSWIPLGYIFESPLLETLLNFFPVPSYRNLTLQCLTEVAALNFGDFYNMQYVNLYSIFLVKLQSILPPNTNIPDAYANGSGEEQAFIQNLALFFTSFFKSHIRVLESSPENISALVLGLEYLINISYVDDTEVFKVCLDYWQSLVLELFEAHHNLDSPAALANMMGLQMPFAGMIDGIGPQLMQRRQLYADPLSKLRLLMICRMAKPEEVLIVEDENGNIVRETMKDNDVLVQYKMPFAGMIDGIGPQLMQRRQLYADPLSKLRLLMICRMAKPEEVLIVEDENGNIVRETMKDNDVLVQYKAMRETLIYLSHLDHEDTEQQMLKKLSKQLSGEDWTWNNLNTLCWAIGSISGSMMEEQENRFLVMVIRDLLNLCEITKGKDNKAIIASNIMYVVGQYPRFLRAHWKFLKTVVNKLFEFMHETHPGVQDMACDTFLKIVQKCRRKFVIVQVGESEPFVSELLTSLPTTIADLEPHQIHSFYESVGNMIQAESDPQKRDEYLQRLMELPNQKWAEIIGQARQSVDFLKDQNVIRTVLNILQTNTSVASSLGTYFLAQITLIFLDMLNVYRMYSELISTNIAEGGPFASKTSYVKLLRSVKRETLKLIETFLDKAEEQPQIGKQFVPPMMDPVLGDYARNLPDARESEVLSLFATIINKYKGSMMEDVPRIFEAVFQCTLEMITKNFEDYPEHRLKFFSLLRAIATHCFPALICLSSQQLKLVMDSIIWAFRHTERNIAETGLNLLVEMLKNFQASEFCNQFYQTYFVTIEQEIFAVLTDSFHKPGFKLHVLVLQHLFCLAESGSLTEPLWDVTTVTYPYPNNAMFVREYTIKLLGTSFPNMTTTEVTQFVNGLFESRNDLSTFKNHIRDFLVQSKEFSAQDNKDLYAEEAAAQRERERQRMLTIPGLIAPNEIQDEMVDS
ncbi:Protein EXPORTIN 1A like [Actinidia chinensis var. chinensis]|uniref:Protein EXPORTIN 1A like n=1 Tax=Actinidia chinensis var. chinensis TaxID=1590841 RepID=A0A2R6RSD3_ACTCC|nr:Protein EXPORTIN 1A like [Actinidia chinensis var. chinensis]